MESSIQKRVLKSELIIWLNKEKREIRNAILKKEHEFAS